MCTNPKRRCRKSAVGSKIGAVASVRIPGVEVGPSSATGRLIESLRRQLFRLDLETNQADTTVQ